MPITQIEVSLNKAEEDQLNADGFTKVEGPLNKLPDGNKIYLWYKKETGVQAVTRIQFSYTAEMVEVLQEATYRQVLKNLNAGGSPTYLWFLKGTTHADVAIKDLHVSDGVNNEATKIQQGWERLTCDLNQNTGGHWAYLWVERETPVYISEIKATYSFSGYGDLYQEGYTRMDDYTNKFVEKERVYIWYRITTDSQRAIGDLMFSANPDKNYIKVNVDLNKGTGRDQLFLCYKKDGNDPIKGIGMLTDQAVSAYEQAGAIAKKMYKASSSFGSFTFYMCFYH